MHIVIEGQDATGKDTQARMLAEYLRGQGKTVVHYAESGSDSEDYFIKSIAELNYMTKQDIDNRTRVLLYLVNRYEQWRKLAEPALKKGDTVITTRSWYSTLIYEGFAGGVSQNLIARLHKAILPAKYFEPDKIVFLTITPEARIARDAARTDRVQAEEVWKSSGEQTWQKIDNGYLKYAKTDGIPTLDAGGSIEEVQRNLRKLFGFEMATESSLEEAIKNAKEQQTGIRRESCKIMRQNNITQ